MQNLRLNPVKRDYVIENGAPVPSDRIEESAYIALTIPRDKWIYGLPNQGSLIYTLQNSKHTSSAEQQFASYAEDAIQRQLIDEGKATAVRAGNIEQTREGSSNQVEVVPSEQQLSTLLNFNSV